MKFMKTTLLAVLLAFSMGIQPAHSYYSDFELAFNAGQELAGEAKDFGIRLYELKQVLEEEGFQIEPYGFFNGEMVEVIDYFDNVLQEDLDRWTDIMTHEIPIIEVGPGPMYDYSGYAYSEDSGKSCKDQKTDCDKATIEFGNGCGNTVTTVYASELNQQYGSNYTYLNFTFRSADAPATAVNLDPLARVEAQQRANQLHMNNQTLRTIQANCYNAVKERNAICDKQYEDCKGEGKNNFSDLWGWIHEYPWMFDGPSEGTHFYGELLMDLIRNLDVRNEYLDSMQYFLMPDLFAYPDTAIGNPVVFVPAEDEVGQWFADIVAEFVSITRPIE